jgi:3-phenylpropionate/trans-cinnamate dioxygenase ferredoxin reductase component
MGANGGCVVVGAGLAAAHVVQTLRAEGYGEPVQLVGDELDRPYERPPLSKDYLQGKTPAAAAFVHDEGWYAANDVETRFGSTVVSVDRSGRRVLLGSGEWLHYQHLVLTTGARPRALGVPGADLAGVHYLRRLGDSDALRSVLAAGGRLAIIGAGWIGLEVAAAARLAGLDVTVLEYGAQPLQRVLGDEMGAYFARLHRAQGVDVRTGVGVTSVLGLGGRATGVQTSDGPVPADAVLIAVGAVPAVELASQAGLDLGDGVNVDERLRSTDPAILAAGDVASARNTALGERLRVDHWDNAIRQGQLAARTIVGAGAAVYDWQPYFYTDQFDLGMEYVGHADAGDELAIRGELADGEFIAFWIRANRIRAAMNVNVWDVSDDLRALIGQPADRRRLADASIPLTDVMSASA